jgi:hypothetical protein
MNIRELCLRSSCTFVFHKGQDHVHQSDDVVERAHNEDEAEDADQQPPDLTPSPQSLPSSGLWYPKQSLGAETACHQVHAITQGFEIMAGELSRCYRESVGIVSRGYHCGSGKGERWVGGDCALPMYITCGIRHWTRVEVFMKRARRKLPTVTSGGQLAVVMPTNLF